MNDDYQLSAHRFGGRSVFGLASVTNLMSRCSALLTCSFHAFLLILTNFATSRKLRRSQIIKFNFHIKMTTLQLTLAYGTSRDETIVYQLSWYRYVKETNWGVSDFCSNNISSLWILQNSTLSIQKIFMSWFDSSKVRMFQSCDIYAWQPPYSLKWFCSITKAYEFSRHVLRMGETKNAYTGLAEKSVGMKSAIF